MTHPGFSMAGTPAVRSRPSATGLVVGPFVTAAYRRHCFIPLRVLLIVLAAGCLADGASVASAAPARPPNIAILFADDLGYGDLGCYGAPSIRTPHLDRMAGEGLRFTSLYSPAEKCTPSRAGLLAGRYAIRSGMTHVLYQVSPGGLPSTEITVATALKRRGYATAHIGKWHLGIVPGTRPNDHGFDLSFGVPYSNDMDPREEIAGTKAYALPDPPLDGVYPAGAPSSSTWIT